MAHAASATRSGIRPNPQRPCAALGLSNKRSDVAPGTKGTPCSRCVRGAERLIKASRSSSSTSGGWPPRARASPSAGGCLGFATPESERRWTMSDAAASGSAREAAAPARASPSQWSRTRGAGGV